MPRTILAVLLLSIGLPTGLGGTLPAAERPEGFPNLVVLLADDLGYGELGCQGNPQIPTPRIDSIAQTGVRMTSGYVTAPNCSPSRAGLLSGRYSTRFGYEFNPIGAKNDLPHVGLPQSERTLAEFLHDHGYTTGLFGKWHLGGSAAYHPQRHGFDEFFGFLHEGHFFLPPPYENATTWLRRKTLPGLKKGRWVGDGTILSDHMGHNEPPYDANNPIIHGGTPVTETEYLTDAFTREATGFIRRHRDKPFFLMLSYNAVHSPLQAMNADLKPFSDIPDVQRRIFAGMLANLDRNVGRVLDTLAKTDLERDTIVIFLSDNGGPTRELTSSNHPLRGQKSDMYEGGIRVPFLMKWPGTLPAGKVYEQPVISLDIYATIAGILAEQTDAVTVPQRLDGTNLIPYLTGERSGSPHRSLYWRQGLRTALRWGDWKIVRNDRRKRAKWELYNLANDRSETTDLAKEHPDRVQQLDAIWSRYAGEMKEPLF